MRIRKFARKVKRAIVKAEPTSAFSKFFIVLAYKAVLITFGKYKKRKKSAIKTIKANISEELAADQSYVNKLFNETLYCRFMYGIAVREYFVYEFEKLSHEGRKTFVTRGNKYPFYRRFNNQNYTPYLNMKTETYRKFKDFYGREVLCMYDENDLEAFLGFVERHPRFIYKPADDYGGHGIAIYDADEYESKEDLFKVLMYHGFCVVEELIVQAHEIAQFHPQSVNTMRVVAFRKNDHEAEIQWCFLRMGMGGSHTDNMSSGGLAAMVDPETGIIYTTGRDWLGYEHIAHPDTGVQLVGFQIPRWDELKTLVGKLANVIPEINLVGWDLSLTEKGWVFVEGNARPQCVSAQITKYNGLLHLYQKMDSYLKGEVINE